MNQKRKQNSRELKQALSAMRWQFLFIGIFSFFLNLLVLVAPFYMLQIYDRVLLSQSKDTLYALTVLAIGLLAIGGLLELVRGRLLVRLGNKLDHHLSSSVFGGILRRRLEDGNAAGSQELRDLETVRGFLSGPGLTAFFDAPWTPAFIVCSMSCTPGSALSPSSVPPHCSASPLLRRLPRDVSCASPLPSRSSPIASSMRACATRK